MTTQEESELLEKVRGISHTLHGCKEQPGLVNGFNQVRKDYYGNGKLGDRLRVTLMWRFGGALLFFAGFGAKSVLAAIIGLVVNK